ncbi:MAG: hypothetical protein CVV64_14095 [Candidatus Wallbacteria bacterium HGW-Wallbacteria-1]|uniref:UVR domain-containing protein n=1 Tax=Candidatus Wallbacteria bacterium HGW-Wallbacteria-1 TaxID=2013854 RepID=A0A2N1PMH1_9BACT|nr:MAG: hypothetical protein CVV64_14095 [Candidatus Wallbacteria bacterium HGW-Wallbacteria-1]
MKKLFTIITIVAIVFCSPQAILASVPAETSASSAISDTASASVTPYPKAPGGDLRNTLPELTRRASDYLITVTAALGPGQCWPGLGTYRRQMNRYAELEKNVTASNLDADKKKHVLTCAKIAAVTKGITGSSSIAHFITMSIGLAKEFYDRSFLNPTGGRDYLDLDADAIGARFAYENEGIPNFDNGRILETTNPMDVRTLSRYREKLAALMERHVEMLSKGDFEKAAKLKAEAIDPLNAQIALMENQTNSR